MLFVMLNISFKLQCR